MTQTNLLTVFHVTHWKAGSQWVRSVLKLAAGDRFVEPSPFPECPLRGSFVPGAVYTPIYSSFSQFTAAVGCDASHRTFVVIRDPRDTLISWYFSLMYSHNAAHPTVLESRQELRGLSKSEGLSLMIGKQIRGVADIQRQWLDAGAPVFRYEDLWADPLGQFARIFDFCQLGVGPMQRRYLICRQSFGLRTFWRLGRSNPNSHLRRGIPGDWKNHFCPDLIRLFKSAYGDVLVQAGYEKNDRW
jgi:lipopolysaccharide transport system ATP-binding protein